MGSEQLITAVLAQAWRCDYDIAMILACLEGAVVQNQPYVVATDFVFTYSQNLAAIVMLYVAQGNIRTFAAEQIPHEGLL